MFRMLEYFYTFNSPVKAALVQDSFIAHPHHKDAQKLILNACEIKDFINIGNTCKYLHELTNELWVDLSKIFKFQNKGSEKLIISYILKFDMNILLLSNLQENYKLNFKLSINNLGVERALKFAQAMDSLDIWDTFERDVTKQRVLFPFVNNFDSIDNFLTKVNDFDSWCEKNSDALSQEKGLNFNSIGLRSIPPQIQFATSLQSLDISHNSLVELPSEIQFLTQLTHLYVSHNLLTKLPPEIGYCAQLTYLDVSSNRLTAWPSQVLSLYKLHDLYYDDNPILGREGQECVIL